MDDAILKGRTGKTTRMVNVVAGLVGHGPDAFDRRGPLSPRWPRRRRPPARLPRDRAPGVTQRHPPKRARGGLILLAALALALALALGPAGPAAAVQIDPSVLPRLACGAPSSPGDVDYWCGQWSTFEPTPSAGSGQSAIAPLGLVSFERVSEADVRPLDGRDFGNFPFRFNQCSGSSVPTLFYAGRYDAGDVLACASSGGAVLGGYWRDRGTSRSGRFTITTGSSSLGSFSGELVQHFLADNLWTGRCLGGWCTTAAPPPAPAPAARAPGPLPGAAADRRPADLPHPPDQRPGGSSARPRTRAIGSRRSAGSWGTGTGSPPRAG